MLELYFGLDFQSHSAVWEAARRVQQAAHGRTNGACSLGTKLLYCDKILDENVYKLYNVVTHVITTNILSPHVTKIT